MDNKYIGGDNMISLIIGKKGTGKTKVLVEHVNDAVHVSSGNVVCVEKETKLTYDVNYRARLVATDVFSIAGYDAFYGFLSGICAGDHDITDIFVDATYRIAEDTDREGTALAAFLNGDMEGLEAATAKELKINMDYETGTVAHLKNIPTFDDSRAENSLIKDIYVGGQTVARVCEEFIPVIDKTKRVTVVYPVVSNKVKYNMGYFIGDDKHKPAKVCWDGANLSVVECNDQPIGRKKELYIRGASFTDNSGDETVTSTVSDYKWSAPGYNGSYDYSLVKIFNKIWMRENYKGNRKEDGDKFGNNYNLEPVWDSWNGSSQCYYSEPMVMENPNPKYPFAPKHWRVPYSEDYVGIVETLQNNQVQFSSAKAFYPDSQGGVLGFHHIYVGHRYVDSEYAWNVEETLYPVIKKNDTGKYEWDGVFAFDKNEESVGQHMWKWGDMCIPIRFVQDIK